MIDQKQAKQSYLTEKIIEANYDPDDFVDYCLKVTGNVDVDSWTMTSLQEIVKGYISSKKTSETAIHQTSFIDYQQDDEKPSFSISNIYERNSVTIDSKPAPFRMETGLSSKQNVKLQPNQKDNLDKLFLDPFKNSFKKKEKQPPAVDWGYDSYPTPTYPREAWADKKKPDFEDEFNFDSWKPKVEKKRSMTTKVQTNYFNPPPTYNQPEFTFQSVSSSKPQSKTEPKATQSININPNQNLNPSIFDINFDDIKDLSLPKKSANFPVKKNSIGESNLNSNDVNQQQEPGLGAADFDLLAVSGSNPTNPTGSKVDPKKKIKAEQRVVQQDWNDVVACIRAKSRTLATKPDLQVVISGHEIVKKNLFMPDEVRYFLKTPAINSEVKRKYNQFLKLRTNLQKFYPGFKLPFIKKTGWIQQTDPGNIATQKSLIAGFMNDLLMNKELKNCRIVEQFLTITDNKALKSKFEQYDKMGKLHSIEELCLLPGEVNVGYSDAHRVYLEKVPGFIHNMEIILDRYKKQLQNFVYTQQLLQKNIQDLFETTSLLESLTKGFNSSVEIGQCYELQATLRLIRKVYKQMDKQSKFESNLFDVELKPLFRYERDNVGTIKEQLQYKARFNETFNPNIKSERKEVYTNVGLDEYKTKIDEPSRSLTVLRYQHGYFATQAVMETKRLLSNFSKKLSHKFGQFAYTAEQRTREAGDTWKQITKAMALPLMA